VEQVLSDHLLHEANVGTEEMAGYIVSIVIENTVKWVLENRRPRVVEHKTLYHFRNQNKQRF